MAALVLTINDSFHNGTLAGIHSALSGEIPNELVVTAVKRGEDGGRVIRFAEYAGETENFDFTLAGCRASGSIGAYKIMTLRDGNEVNLLELP